MDTAACSIITSSDWSTCINRYKLRLNAQVVGSLKASERVDSFHNTELIALLLLLSCRSPGDSQLSDDFQFELNNGVRSVSRDHRACFGQTTSVCLLAWL